LITENNKTKPSTHTAFTESD